MASSLDMTVCRRCGGPMAAVVGRGSLPRYLCRLCGDAGILPPLPAIGAPLGRTASQLVACSVEQVELSLHVVVCRDALALMGRQPLHQPAARYSDQFPLHRTQLPQRHCA